MCACEPSFTCSKCRDTPADPRYLWDEPETKEDCYTMGIAPGDRPDFAAALAALGLRRG
jgi:hypothetical protein